MIVGKTSLVSYLICSYFLFALDVYAERVDSEMCLEQAVTIHALLNENICPYHLLGFNEGFRGCTVRCKAKFTNNNDFHEVKHCVEYNMSFHINENLTSKFTAFPCDITNCILEVMEFECMFIEENSEFENLDKIEANKAPGNKTDNINHKNTTEADGPCIDAASSVVIGLSCVLGGCLLGISAFVFVKRLRTNKRRLQPPPVFYQPHYGDEGDTSGGRIVTIANSSETEYADIEETIKMVAKAVQVPSYKEDSSSETRSRENIYHHLSLFEDTVKKENSTLISSDSIPNSFADDMILSNKSSPSFKSVVICTDSSSSKSNGNSKVSPTGSAGSDKYYALEKEYLIFDSNNGKT